MTVLRGLDAVLEPSKQAVLDLKASPDRARMVHRDQALREAAGHVLRHLEVHAARPQPRGRAGALGARQFALSVALGGIAPPVVAGAATVFCRLMPSFARPFLADPRPWVHWLASAGYYLAPAQMPASLLGESFAKELLAPHYGLYAQVLVENVLYAVAVMVVACLVFARREIRLSS